MRLCSRSRERVRAVGNESAADLVLRQAIAQTPTPVLAALGRLETAAVVEVGAGETSLVAVGRRVTRCGRPGTMRAGGLRKLSAQPLNGWEGAVTALTPSRSLVILGRCSP